MAILSNSVKGIDSLFLNVDDFISGLNNASESIAQLVDESGRHISNAFLIAPNLAVVPLWALNSTQNQFTANPEFISKYELVFHTRYEEYSKHVILENNVTILEITADEPLSQARPLGVALISFSQLSFKRVLPFFRDNAEIGQNTTIIQNPEGGAKCFNFGVIEAITDTTIRYNNDTRPGSSGAPVLNAQWKVLGIHAGWMKGPTDSESYNWAISINALLSAARTTTHWAEIRDFHKILDINSITIGRPQLQNNKSDKPTKTILLKAAVNARLDKSKLTDTERNSLSPYIPDTNTKFWSLRTKDRKRILKGVSSLSDLKQYVLNNSQPPVVTDVLETILSGPPYQLENKSEDFLNWFAKASSWFDGIDSSLPTTNTISKMLEKQRLQRSLHRARGDNFLGRETEILKLDEWFNGNLGILLLSGVGGIGKSAIIAEFLLRKADVPIFWLDFDRPDLAPDDAMSILNKLVNTAIQIWPGLSKLSNLDKDWPVIARTLAKYIESNSREKAPPVLVLDSFEAAQYSTKFTELWPVLSVLEESISKLRIVITGRAPVKLPADLKRKAYPMDLTGLEPEDAQIWLNQSGIKAPAAVKEIIRLTRSVPLNLRLAVRLVEAGENFDQVPNDLPKNLVAGYLHSRILDRIQRPDMRRLAGSVLVLRQVTVDLLEPIFSGLIELPTGEPAEWFEELAREMSVVEGENILIVRPEVRSETLWLLEHENLELVNKINQRALEWYGELDTEDPKIAAELVYHNLRVGDIEKAVSAWKTGCSAFLSYSIEDLRDESTKSWLESRLASSTPNQLDAPEGLVEWEHSATVEIKNLYSRGKLNSAYRVLQARDTRSSDNRLLAFDVLSLIHQDKMEDAFRLMSEASASPVEINEFYGQFTTLHAWLEQQNGRTSRADFLLEKLSHHNTWLDHDAATLYSVASMASRIELTIKPKLEWRLWKLLKTRADSEFIATLLEPIEVTNPFLNSLLIDFRDGRDFTSLESSNPIFNV